MKGIATVVSFAVVILITVSAVGVVLLVGVPALEKARELGIVNEARLNMETIDFMIKQASSEGTGALKLVQLKVNDGTYRVDLEENALSYSVFLEGGFLPVSNFTDGRIEKNVSATASGKTLEMKIFYDRIVLNGTERFGSGNHKLCITNSERQGTNVILDVRRC